MGFLYSLLPRTKKCCWAPKIALCFAPTRNRLGSLKRCLFWLIRSRPPLTDLTVELDEHWYVFIIIHHYSSLFIIIHHYIFIIIHHYSSQNSDSSPNIFEASRAEAFGGPWQPNHVAQLAPLVLSFRLPWHVVYFSLDFFKGMGTPESSKSFDHFSHETKALGTIFGNTRVFGGETRILAKPWQHPLRFGSEAFLAGIKPPEPWWTGSSSSTYDVS